MWTRSPCVTHGYHNLPEVTREKIVDGWLRTGDIFRVDADGFLYFMGRVDDMFSCGGENIYPKEVENLLFAHPAVRDVCVVPIPHEVKGLVPAAAVVAARARARDDGRAQGLLPRAWPGLCASTPNRDRRRIAAVGRWQTGSKSHPTTLARRQWRRFAREWGYGTQDDLAEEPPVLHQLLGLARLA